MSSSGSMIHSNAEALSGNEDIVEVFDVGDDGSKHSGGAAAQRGGGLIDRQWSLRWL